MYTSSLPLFVSFAWLPFAVSMSCFSPSRHFAVTLALSLMSPRHIRFQVIPVFPVHYLLPSSGSPGASVFTVHRLLGLNWGESCP